MTEDAIIRMIRSIIKRELAPILMGVITGTDDSYRATGQRFSTEGQIGNMRMIQPYGLASRPPAGTQCVVQPINSDASHLNIVGQFDLNRPVLNDGDSCLYGADGQVVYMKKGGTIHQGTLTAANPVVLGDVLMDYITDHLNAFINGTQVGIDSFGLPVYLDPTLRTALMMALNKYVTTTSTNVVGQKNFVDRGA